MNIIEAPQGSDLWLQIRAKHFTASEAPAMLGISKYKTRQALLREKATGLAEEVDANKQRLFDAGHDAEAAARPLAEAFLQEDLFPATGAAEIDGLPLLASFDGLNMEETLVWENKLESAGVLGMIAQGILDGTYWPQVEQQLLVSGAERALFTACDGEKITAQLWYESQPERRAALIAGWKQFAEDLANYQHIEAAPVAVAAPIKDLPAVVLTVSGALTIETNFAAWGVELRNFISRIPEKPSTDQEFADCKAAVSAFKKAEAQLDAEEKRVLSMVADIDEMQREKKLLKELSSTTRLALEKLVVRRDQETKIEIMQEGMAALAAHLSGLNKRLATVQMPAIAADFAAAIKGKKLYSSMRDAVAALLAQKKLEANALADAIQINLSTLDASKEYAFLFSDRAAIAMKAPDDLALLIKSRIDDHKADEAKREEETRQRIRAEEEARAAAKVKAEQAKEDALIASIWANANRIEFDSVPYIKKAIDHFDSGSDLSQDPRPRVAAAFNEARLQMQKMLVAAKDRADQEAERQRKAGEEAAAKIVSDRAHEAIMEEHCTLEKARAITKTAPQAAPDISRVRLDETPAVAAHTGVTGVARLLDRLDDLTRQMTERELSDLCVHAAHILSSRKEAS